MKDNLAELAGWLAGVAMAKLGLSPSHDQFIGSPIARHDGPLQKIWLCVTATCSELGSSMAQYTVSAGHASAWLDYVESRGVSAAMLVESAGIDPAFLADPDGRIPFMAYIGMVRGAKDAAGDSGLVLRFGADAGAAGLGILGLIMEASSTMGEAFLQMQRYGRLVVEMECDADGPRFALEASEAGLFGIDRRKDPNAFPELTELSFSRLTCGPRRFLTQPHVLAVEVTHEAPEHAALYDEVFQCPVRFGAERNALKFHPDIAGWPVGQNPRYVFDILAERADALLGAMEGSRTVRGEVEARLVERLHEGDISADQLAGEMGISRQTLYRRLKAEGTGFADVLDALRHRLALQYLMGRKVSVNETAYLVGFSEPTAFSHAFKRWTGQSPQAYRHERQARG